jgi:outer membrane protein, multidrug efflux system
MRPKTIAIAMPLLIASVSGCNLTPEYLRPEIPIPATFTAKSAAPVPNVDPAWWRIFRSGMLSSLIAEANADNTDIAAAFRRIGQARASYKIARSSLFPAISIGRSDLLQRRNAEGLPPEVDHIYDTSANLDYEVDIFGGNRAATASARADVASRIFDREDIELAVQAQIATTYIELLLARERRRIASGTIGNVTDVLRVVEARFEAGAGTALDTSQQKTALGQARAVRAQFSEDVRNAENALAVLIGDVAGTIKVSGAGLAAMRVPSVSPGQPAALLYRRADIRRAEANLVAANADIGVARAALFPSLNLSLEAALTNTPVKTVTTAVGSSILAPIFQGGRLRANVRLTEERKAELVEDYRETVLVALQQVEDALAAIKWSRQRVANLTSSFEAARDAYRLSRIQYEAGAIDFTTLLDAQRNQFEVEDSLAIARADRLLAVVNLIAAVGGGWVESSS